MSDVSTTSQPRSGIGTNPPPLSPDAFFECEFWDIVIDTMAGTVERAITRHGERGAVYTAPLPSPEDRRRIREEAGLTQQDVTDELFASRWTVTRWERPAGYRNGTRLAGRESVGELREAYSELLRKLSSLESAGH